MFTYVLLLIWQQSLIQWVVLLQEYTKGLHYVREFLKIEPGNQQVHNLETLIKKRMEKGLCIRRN
jgi:hypothetical protein